MFAAMTDNKAHRPAASLPASLLLLPAISLGLLLGTGPAAFAQAKKPAAPATETKRIGKFSGWDAYEHTDKGAKLCYLHAQPQ